MNTPVMTEKLEEEEANEIEIKVQGNDTDSKKTFKISKVITSQCRYLSEYSIHVCLFQCFKL